MTVVAWSAVDLLARCQRQANRPATDQGQTPADWYAMLTEAEAEWRTTIATVAPAALYGAPVMLTSTDGGHTWPFPLDSDGNPTFPMGALEVRARRNGQLMIPCSDWSDRGDFLTEGTQLRIPNGRTRVFSDGGPWVRYVTPPGPIGDGVVSPVGESQLVPRHARILLVYRACSKWARRGGRQDPQPYLDLENEAWYGNQAAGVTGLLGMYKTQYQFAGADAIPEEGNAWWRGISDSPRGG